MAQFSQEDLLFEILLLLPLKSLLRFRRVSRGWRDLIDSRNFAKSHFNNLSNRPPSLLVIREEFSDNSYDVTDLSFVNSYDVVDLSSVCNGGSPPPAFKELPIPRQSKIPCYVDHCNGLFCISGYTGVLLWNPATGKRFQFGLWPRVSRVWDWGFGYDKDSDDFKVAAMHMAAEGEDWDWGFGYDKDSDDFKVVAMHTEAGGGYMVWIYSLRSRSWKRIGYFPYLFPDSVNRGVYFSGALHWIVHQLGSYVYSVGALHLGKLEYNLVPIQDYNSEPSGKYLSYLGVLDGHLCVMYYSTNYDQCDLWMMKEYGVMESWTKLSINCGDYGRLKPLAYVENEEVLLFNADSNKMLGCELKTRSFRKLIESEGHLLLKWYTYVPSLFSP